MKTLHCSLLPIVTWRAFTRGVPQVFRDFFQEGRTLPHCDVILRLDEKTKLLDSSKDLVIPNDLIIPALQAILGDNPRQCLQEDLVGSHFEFKSKTYRLGYTFDPEEYEYGWYIVELNPA